MGVIRRMLAARSTWVLLGAFLLWTLGRIAVRGLAHDPRFDALPDFRHVRAPAWGGDPLMEPVLESLRALGPVNLFDPAFESRIAGALSGLPAIARVTELRKIWPRRYAVRFSFRRPVAVVSHQGRRIPVTADGVALPHAPYSFACTGLLEITGLRRSPPAPGEVWRSERLLDGLATLRQIGPHLASLAALGISVIDVEDSPDPRRGVLLRGADEITVRWGRPRASVGENPVDQKIRFLGIAAANVDQVRGFEIEIRYGEFYLRESDGDAPSRRSAP